MGLGVAPVTQPKAAAKAANTPYSAKVAVFGGTRFPSGETMPKKKKTATLCRVGRVAAFGACKAEKTA